MRFDGTIDLAIGFSSKTRLWKNKRMLWSELVTRLKQTARTPETYREYMASSREDQGRIKDVGGFVGGMLRGGRRKPENVSYRQLLTLDLDFAHLDFWEDFQMIYGNAAVLHGSHKHSPATPRYRLILPLNRECTPDEYVATARQVAGVLGIELFDGTTFEPNRLMYWPSTSKDMEYYFESQDGAWLDVDKVLDSYADWTDSSQWPTSKAQGDKVKSDVEKLGDPRDKKGLIGAWCRAYGIEQVIKAFLSEEYVLHTENRYTYTKGSTSSGLVVYDNLFAYSHHGTDPASGKTSNAFDLVRLHKFGHLDTENSEKNSFAAMEDFVRNNDEVKRLIAAENFNEARIEFGEDYEYTDIEWASKLKLNSKGEYDSSAANIANILANDERLKNRFRYNEFDAKGYVFTDVPWRKLSSPNEPIKNVDFAGIRQYMELTYNITSTPKIDDALILEMFRNSFHPVREYLNGLEWDGVPRIDSLLPELFGVEDSLYTREAMRKTLVGAVARVMNPGVKFDTTMVLVSKLQGSGKSSFIKALGKDWASENFSTVQGKEAFEQLQGAWVIEIAELAGFKKAENETVKHFLSKTEDTYRPAYGRAIETFKRQCITIGSSNSEEFITDYSGGRRFLPIKIKPVKRINNPKLMAFLASPDAVDLLYAEAVHLYEKGETLYLSREADDMANVLQQNHSIVDERRGLIEKYLSTKISKDWDSKDVMARRMYVSDDELAVKGTEVRQTVTVAEIWTECLGKPRDEMDRYKTRELNEILRSLDDWEFCPVVKNFPIYGKQKYYKRIEKTEETEEDEW